MVIAKGWGRENRELGFNGGKVSVGEDEKILEMDGGDGHTVTWMHLTPLNCTLTKWLKW